MYGEDFSKVLAMGRKKKSFLNDNKMGYLLSAMLAGLFVGLGIMLAFTVGGSLKEVASPYTKIVIGLSFSVALALVIFAGAELFTSGIFVMASGLFAGEVNIKELIKLWFYCYFGNFLGAIIGVSLYYSSGLWRGTAGEYMVESAMKKINVNYSELFIRGILCNILVCLAVWCTIRMREETGKILMMALCVYAFVAVGFEHSVANMSLLTIGYIVPYGSVTLGGILYNLFFVTLGNIVGGVLFVAVPYYLISKNRQVN